MKNDRIYCRRCGSKLLNHLIPNCFNEKTGKQEVGQHCPNLQCTEGCEYDGHKWCGIFKSGDKCKRCGYWSPDY